MSIKKLALILGISQYIFKNPYEDLPVISSTGHKQTKKYSYLTKKQKKARAASKRAKVARRLNR